MLQVHLYIGYSVFYTARFQSMLKMYVFATVHQFPNSKFRNDVQL